MTREKIQEAVMMNITKNNFRRNQLKQNYKV